MPIEERKALEEAGQEIIEFISADTSPEERLKVDETKVENIQKEVSTIPSQEGMLDENTRLENNVQLEYHNFKLPEEIKDIRIESERSSQLEIQDGEKSSTKEELIQEENRNISEAEIPKITNGQPQKFWKLWREKIQVFIKKLFA